jgi:hypothetical protein
MATFTKEILSASTDGLPILISNTSTPGTIIHSASSNTSVQDEIWIYAMNTDNSSRKLTIEFGGTTSPDNLIELTVQPEAGLVLVVPGLILKGNATPKQVTAFSSAGNVVTISGYVNRISQ